MKFIRKYFGIVIDDRNIILYIVNDSLHIFWRENRFTKDSWDYWTFVNISQVGSIVADGYTSLDAKITIKGKRITFQFAHFIDNATFRLYYPSLFI